MALPGGVSVLAFAALCTIGIGTLLHVVGLATPSWSSKSENGATGSFGLWEVCQDVGPTYTCGSYTFWSMDDELASSVRACEALAILGMLASFLGVGMAALTVLWPMTGKPKNATFPLVSLVGCVASFFFILITVIVWGAKVHADYLSQLDIGYSLILSIVGLVLIGVGGVLSFVDNDGFLRITKSLESRFSVNR